MLDADILVRFERWQRAFSDDEDATKELNSVKTDESELANRFEGDLTFGTGGLRGRMELGSNRFNLVVVRRVTQGFANYIHAKKLKPLVNIAYDTRKNSLRYAMAAAEVMAANKINVFLFDASVPTPLLSYSVRELKASGGIMITASHNPCTDNGYKVYDSDGCQLLPDEADLLMQEIAKCDPFEDIVRQPFEFLKNLGTIQMVPSETIDRFMDCATSNRLSAKREALAKMRIVYTPLNGAGRDFILRGLSTIGINPIPVPQQMTQDGDFLTCPLPNPEERGAWREALRIASEHDAQIVIATDPDCDRIGLVERLHDGTYRYFIGNEIGVLLLETLLSHYSSNGMLPSNPVIVKSIVTTPMAYEIAKSYNANVIDVLTGFKYIGRTICLMQDPVENFIFGFEESMGYLANPYVRDKDAVSTCILIVCMIATLYDKGISLTQALASLHDRYGYHLTSLKTYEFSGHDNKKQVDALFFDLQRKRTDDLRTDQLICLVDYRKGKKLNTLTNEESSIDLPITDMVTYKYLSGSDVTFRLSGTESKLKVYFYSCGETEATAQSRIEECVRWVDAILQAKRKT